MASSDSQSGLGTAVLGQRDPCGPVDRWGPRRRALTPAQAEGPARRGDTAGPLRTVFRPQSRLCDRLLHSHVALLTPPSARPGSPASLQVSFWRTCADKIRRGQISKSVPCGMRARTGFLDLPGCGAGGWSVDGT